MMSNNRQGIDWRDSLRQLLDPEQQSDVESVGANEPVQAPAETVFGGRKLDIVLDEKGRRGKQATIIAGFDTDDDTEALAVAARLKQSLGTGGSARGGEILIQGDRRKDVASLLTGMGYKTRII